MGADIVDLVIADLRDVQEALDELIHHDDGAEVENLRHLASLNGATWVLGADLIPGVAQHLLDTQGETLLLGIDAEHHRLDLVALLEGLGRVG